MKTFRFHNPVQVHFGVNSLSRLPQLLGRRRFLLLSSAGWTARGLESMFRSLDLCPSMVIDTVEQNPSLQAVLDMYRLLPVGDFEAIVAFGGGSVIDTAKVLAVRPEGGFQEIEKLICESVIPHNYEVLPIIAVPTTAGTGSEVTPWGTVWDFHEKRKHSISLPDLWCESSICDPQLTLSLPQEVTLQTGLDALSHSFEAIWNRRSNPVSDALAADAVKSILEHLPIAVTEPENIEARASVLYGSLLAGLAFSQTQTTIAHALSYSLTIEKGIPHGIACSFSLPAALESLDEEMEKHLIQLLPMIGSDPANVIRNFLKDLGQPSTLSGLGISPTDGARFVEDMLSYPQVSFFRGDPRLFLKKLL